MRTGRGLRGGGYTVTTTPTATRIDYHNTQFTNDVYLNGQVTLDTTNTLTGRVTLIAPGERTGTLTVHAVLWDPAHPLASLRGTLGGRAIAVLTQTR